MKRNELLGLCELVNNRMYHLTNELGGREVCPISIIDMDTWEWAQGVGLYGMMKFYEETKNTEVLNYLVQWFDSNIRKGLPGKNINTVCPLLTLTKLYTYTGNSNYLGICKEWAEWVMTSMPRTEEMGLQHIVSGEDNPGQIWIDSLFMTVLFLAQMGRITGEDRYTAESVRQFLVHVKYLTDKSTGLFNHGFDFTTRQSFGEIQWGRGNCWYTAGVVDYLDLLEDSYLGVKLFLIDTLRAQVNALAKYQHTSGMWHTLIRFPDSYLEASATAGFAYGILKAVRRGYITSEFRECGIKGLQAILNRISPDGTVKDVSYGTAIAADPELYRRVPLCPMTYGQALTLMLLVEAMRLAEDAGQGDVE